jgi:hypothetical protein
LPTDDRPPPPEPEGTDTSPPRDPLPETQPNADTTLGEVLALDDGREAPLAGATVFTSDGRSADTGENGTFTLVGPPPVDGVYVAAKRGFLTSSVAGLSGVPSLHLRPDARVATPRSVASPATVTVTGEVRGPDGVPMADVLVLVGGPGVVSSIPVRADARGQYSCAVIAPGGRVEGATVLAVEMHGAAMGMRTLLTIEGPSTRLPTFKMKATTLACRVAVEPGRPGLAHELDMRVVGPSRVSMPLFGSPDALRAAELPGFTYELTVYSRESEPGATSIVHRPALPMDWTAPQQTFREALLAPPTFSSPLVDLVPGQWLSWEPVPGARGYLVEVGSVGAVAELPFEGFTAGTTLQFLRRDPAWPAGGYHVAVSALDTAGATPRGLASVDGRRLRTWQSPSGWRIATRKVVLTR